MLDGRKKADLFANLVGWRRLFHRYPELSDNEWQTASKISTILANMEVETHRYDRHAGVVGIIRGQRPGPVIALRADMDALPMVEENDVSYKSSYPGVMHACGHDAHMAILLGVASLYQDMGGDFSGTIKLLFQPAEEAAPVGGASRMLEEGILDDVSAIFGLHVWPDLPVGHIGIRAGAQMAASDRFVIRVTGKGAHAGQPHHGVDAVVIAADIINGLGHIMNRQINPLETATLSVGTIHGGDRYNVVAQTVTLEGTVRTLSEKVRQEIPKKMKCLLTGITNGYGASYELEYHLGYPVLMNTPEAVDVVVRAARECWDVSVNTEIQPSLGAEDFARYLAQTPGAFFWLGCAAAESQQWPIHNSRFDMDETALLVGAQVLYKSSLKAMDFYQPEGRNHNQLSFDIPRMVP